MRTKWELDKVDEYNKGPSREGNSLITQVDKLSEPCCLIGSRDKIEGNVQVVDNTVEHDLLIDSLSRQRDSGASFLFLGSLGGSDSSCQDFTSSNSNWP